MLGYVKLQRNVQRRAFNRSTNEKEEQPMVDCPS